MQTHTNDVATGPMAAFPTAVTSAPSGVRLRVCDYGDPSRSEAEDFIRDRFARMYDARVQQQMPRLLTFHDQQNHLVAALGLREAVGQSLFLETYLDAPVERCIARNAQQTIARSRVVEIGNLALAAAGQARIVIMAMTAFLSGAGIDWVVFTAVVSLRNAFQRMGLAPDYLADANASRLGAKSADWGRYYQAQPQVYAGNVRQGAACLETGLFQPDAAMHRDLWLGAYLTGLCHS